MIQTQVTIINKLGLHARAAAKFVGCASGFRSSVRTGRDGQLVDGKSIMAVMMLAAGKGSTLLIETEGEDEDEALAALVELIESGFGEEIE